MANSITLKFSNQITTIEELKGYLIMRIAHIKSVDGKLTRKERECQDILEMIPEDVVPQYPEE